MVISKPIARTVLLLMGFVLLAQGCVVAPREGFYDRDHHRWWHENRWQDCGDRDDHCRDQR